MRYDIKIVDAQISDVYIGDTVIYDGHMRTLTRSIFLQASWVIQFMAIAISLGWSL